MLEVGKLETIWAKSQQLMKTTSWQNTYHTTVRSHCRYAYRIEYNTDYLEVRRWDDTTPWQSHHHSMVAWFLKKLDLQTSFIPWRIHRLLLKLWRLNFTRKARERESKARIEEIKSQNAFNHLVCFVQSCIANFTRNLCMFLLCYELKTLYFRLE